MGLSSLTWISPLELNYFIWTDHLKYSKNRFLVCKVAGRQHFQRHPWCRLSQFSWLLPHMDLQMRDRSFSRESRPLSKVILLAIKEIKISSSYFLETRNLLRIGFFGNWFALLLCCADLDMLMDLFTICLDINIFSVLAMVRVWLCIEIGDKGTIRSWHGET